MLLHAHFVLIRCVLDHLGVGREGMKRRQDVRTVTPAPIRLANAMPCWTAFPASSDPSAPGLPQARGSHTRKPLFIRHFPAPLDAIWHRGLRSGALGDVLGFVNGPRPPFNFPGAWLYSAGHPVLHLNGISHTDKQQRDDSGVIDHIAFGGPRNDRPYSTSRRSDQRQPLKHNGRACARPLRSRCCYLRREPRTTSAMMYRR
jgi:hypothetical protein